MVNSLAGIYSCLSALGWRRTAALPHRQRSRLPGGSLRSRHGEDSNTISIRGPTRERKVKEPLSVVGQELEWQCKSPFTPRSRQRSQA